MWLPLIFFLLMLGIAFYQSTQGLFSALLMAVLTICCAAGALGTYEWVAIHWLAPFWQPNYAMAICLAGLFFIPLIVIRIVLDKTVRRSCLLPGWADRAGAGLCGLIIGFVLVGVMAHAVQMIPFSFTILGFSRVNPMPPQLRADEAQPPQPDAGERGMWLKPDRVALAVAGITSSGIFSGGRQLAEDHPDPVQAVGWLNATHQEVSRYAPPNSISLVRSETVPFVYNLRPSDARSGGAATYEPKPPTAGHEFKMLRVRLGRDARDENKSHIFTIRQFRLVGRLSSGDDAPIHQYHPIAIQQADATQATNRHIRTETVRGKQWPVVDNIYVPRDGNNEEVEIVFELPVRFQPHFLEYKKCARTPVKFESPESQTQAPPSAPPSAPTTTEVSSASGRPTEPAPEESTRPSRSRRRRTTSTPGEETRSSSRGGRARGLVARPGESFFGDEMPLTLKAYRRLRDAQISREAISNGHLIGYVDEQESGNDPPVTKFAVPEDKRLFHLNTGRLHARSSFGQALSRAASTVQNYFVEDARGNRYVLIGKYAVAKVEGRDVVEIEYFPEQVGTIGGLGQFEMIQDRHLERDYELVMLFLVDPGAEIVSFSTGGTATRGDDLRGQGLVAPE